MPVPVFAQTHTTVHDHFFPSLAAFSGSTKPTSTIVGEMVTAEAARLYGALAAVSVSASTISTDAGTTYPAAYAWCQDTVRLGAAIRVMQAIAGAGAVPKAWTEELEKRYKLLEEKGYLALGDAPSPSESVSGPRSHVTVHDLDTGDEADMSTAEPKFRRDDSL